MPTPLYHLDWLTLGGMGYTDSAGVQWILMEETGFWDSPEPRTDIVERVNAHGSFVGPSWFRHRVVTLKGRAYHDDPRIMRSAQSRVTGMGAGPNQTMTLTCDSAIGPLECDVRRDDAVITTPVRVLSSHAFEFSMQLVAPDPRKYSRRWRTMRAGLPRADEGDGLDFNQIEPTVFGQRVAPLNRGLDFTGENTGGLQFGTSNATGFLQLTNAGTAPTAPIYTLYGPLEQPVLTATTGGETAMLRYNARLEADDHVVINPTTPSVLLDGTASRRHLLNPAEFSGFYIPPATADGHSGALNVGLRHNGATTAGGYATATFRDAWY